MTTAQRLPAWPSDLAETHRFQVAPTSTVDTAPIMVGALGQALSRIAPGRCRGVADLGAGNMGEVALAEDSLLGRRVAIKRLRPTLAADPWHRWRLRNEARIAAQLDHPAIVRVLDLVCEEGVDHIVMEYVPGPSLRTRRASGPLALVRVAQIAGELADALDHVHAHGVIHRDVKLENVLTSHDGRPKLNDFGIACTAASATVGGGEVMGTPREVARAGARRANRSALRSVLAPRAALRAGRRRQSVRCRRPRPDDAAHRAAPSELAARRGARRAGGAHRARR